MGRLTPIPLTYREELRELVDARLELRRIGTNLNQIARTLNSGGDVTQEQLQAVVERVQVDRATGAVLPTVVTIQWPAQDISMKLMLSGIETNALDGAVAGRLFSRADLASIQAFDLARGAADTPSSLRRAGGTLPMRR